ncbi:MAG TPA: PHP domain-containing protein [Dehalococcoidia bacterium]|nr:PHP domain-containing protein [Dehalococcoidia bacterium]
MKADLHLHTTASDGRLSPQEIVRKASELGLDVIAITDHDTVEGIQPALEAARGCPHLAVIPGVEISTNMPQTEVHILGYFIDHTSITLNESLKELRDSRYNRGQKMVAKLSEMGIDIKWERVVELAKGGNIGRPHIAQAMLERGYVTSLKEAFTKYIGRNGPAYIERKKVTPVEAIDLILKTSGLPFLAHPADIENLEPFVAQLKQAGIMGLEVYYANYSRSTIAHLQNVASRHGLATSGGSDYHGLDNAIGADIGSVDLPQEAVQQMISLAEQKRMVIP